MTSPWARRAIGVSVLAVAYLAFRPSVPLLVALLLIAGAISWGKRSQQRSAGRTHLVFTRATGVVVVVVLFSLSAYTRGSPTGLFVCFAAVGLASLDLAVAVAVTRRVSATLTVDRTEVLVGDEVTATMTVSGPPFPVSVKLGPSPSLATDPAAEGTLVVSPSARCVIVALPLEVASAGLCGIVGMRRQQPVVLPQRVFAGPRPRAPGRLLPDLGGTWGDRFHLPAPTGDTVRGVRDYVPGDRRSQVHWRATARTGRLVVKEVEEPYTPVLTILLDLGYGGDPAGERAAARAAWYINEGFQRGADVVLVTLEADGARTAPVHSAGDAIRRLASARFGPPHAAPTAMPGRRLLRIGVEGDSWR